jgi:hypothetical protein
VPIIRHIMLIVNTKRQRSTIFGILPKKEVGFLCFMTE